MSRARVFRIEQVAGLERDAIVAPVGANDAPAGAGFSAGQVERILAAIADLKRAVEPAEQVSVEIVNDYKSQMLEARKLKNELDEIYGAITDTKREIATLHVAGFQGEEMARVTDELGAIVTGTEHATESILSAAEDIDTMAGDLQAMLKASGNIALASDIQDRVVQIFEACNFQDLTGQRITKVVNALRFIEDRVIKMIEIWGGMEVFQDVELDPDAKPHLANEHDELLNGPALENDINVASQDDIDALFD
ncbi:MAG: protein phosphatase CheZ [Pseudomonadota bacterium]